MMDCPNFIETYKTEEYELCDKIVARLEELLNDSDQAHHYMDGTQMHGSTVERKDHSFNFKAIDDPLAVDMHSVLGRCVGQYGLKYPAFAAQGCMSDDMKVQKTPPKGGFHTWHCEQGPQNNSSFRNLVWTFYLNDLPDGEGETEFLEYGIKVRPAKGDLCLFPAAWTHTHRGNPVYSQDKYIATGWYYLV